MDWTAQTEINRNVLKRIVAILFALADLADRAAGRPWPVRRLVLWALQQADDVAKEFVAGSACCTAGGQWQPALTTARHGRYPADAVYLAASLRTLALMVGTMAAQARRRRGATGRREAGSGADEIQARKRPKWRSSATGAERTGVLGRRKRRKRHLQPGLA